jgi:opacity protein-like surface antigen
MKTLLLATLSLCFALSVVAFSQDVPNQALQKTQAAAGGQLTTIMGTVQEDGEKLRFVTEQRAWKVDNPETLKGHEGHYVHAAAFLYPDRNLIHITEVKIPTARETREADIK